MLFNYANPDHFGHKPERCSGYPEKQDISRLRQYFGKEKGKLHTNGRYRTRIHSLWCDNLLPAPSGPDVNELESAQSDYYLHHYWTFIRFDLACV